MIKENGGLMKLVAFIMDAAPPEEEDKGKGGKDKGKASRAGKKGKDEGRKSSYITYNIGYQIVFCSKEKYCIITYGLNDWLSFPFRYHGFLPLSHRLPAC